jgi:hypothetical protein
METSTEGAVDDTKHTKRVSEGEGEVLPLRIGKKVEVAERGTGPLTTDPCGFGLEDRVGDKRPCTVRDSRAWLCMTESTRISRRR